MSIFTRSSENATNPAHQIRREGLTGRSSAGSEPSGEVSIVARGVQIDGDVRVNGDVRVGGRINGSVSVAERIVVAPEGVIYGGIESGEADIAGTVEGDVTARGRLVLRKSGSIMGQIVAENLVVEDGAAVSGTCKVGKPARVETEKEGLGDGAPEGASALLPLE